MDTEQKFHHRMEYPDGRVFNGEIDRGKDIEGLGLSSLDGLRVLDIATNDGFFAFWAEQHGAKEVVAIDVGSYKDYDWGPAGPRKDIEQYEEQDKWKTFDFHHSNLNSKVVKVQMSVYDIEKLGKFDVVFNYGLVYHLRNPIAALDACRRVCTGFCVVESECSFLPEHVPIAIEMGDIVQFGSPTDTFLPSRSCLAHWLKRSDFEYVYLQKVLYNNRATAIGVVDEKYMPWFENGFTYCGHRYWINVHKAIAVTIPNKPVTWKIKK